MELRIHRVSHWERSPGQELRLGGPPPFMELVHTDTLQQHLPGYCADGRWIPGVWIDVPIFQAEPIPPHPHKLK